MIALDVSKSMLSQDEKPTRLDKAKQFIYQLSQNLQNNNIGLIVFAGEAFLQMPLTSDMAAAKIFISNASPDLVNLQGTVVSDALYLCDASLNTKEKKSKAVVLITDGEDHDAKALDAAKKLTEHGAAVYTIGVGSIQGSPILDAVTNEYKRDRDGQTIITKLNETLLKDLAKATNGSYNILDNTATVAATLANELNSLEKKPISSSGGNINYQSFYMYLLAFALVLLSIEFFMSERKLKLA
jgi:Ca-activated chloride channel family protein